MKKYIKIKNINFTSWVNKECKSICDFLNVDKDKKPFCCWQDDIIHAYKSFYLYCGPTTKVLSKLKSIDENEELKTKNWKACGLKVSAIIPLFSEQSGSCS